MMTRTTWSTGSPNPMACWRSNAADVYPTFAKGDSSGKWFTRSRTPALVQHAMATPNCPWNWCCLSLNTGITGVADVLSNPYDKPWDWYWLNRKSQLLNHPPYSTVNAQSRCNSASHNKLRVLRAFTYAFGAPSSILHPLIKRPRVLPAHLLLLLWCEVVRDVERLTDLLGGFPLDHHRHGVAGQVQKALDVEVVSCQNEVE